MSNKNTTNTAKKIINKRAFIHGELLGPKIQSNLYDVSDFRFYVCYIYNKTDNVFLKQEVVDI